VKESNVVVDCDRDAAHDQHGCEESDGRKKQTLPSRFGKLLFVDGAEAAPGDHECQCAKDEHDRER
jgi:hypothetical protein